MSAQIYWAALIVSWVQFIKKVENLFQDIFDDFEKQKDKHLDILKKIVFRNHDKETESSAALIFDPFFKNFVQN